MAGGMAKVTMVTGAGSGIGRSVALRLAGEGTAVGVLDNRGEAAEATVEEVSQKGGKAVAFVCDVRVVEDVERAISRLEQDLGPLDAQVNCAGVWQAKPFLELTAEDWDLVMDVNARGLFFCVQAAGRVMASRQRGAIVNISSVGGRCGRPLHAHYAASKAAVISITRSAALALGPQGVRVNAVCPGAIHTPMLSQVLADRTRREGDPDIGSISARIPLGRPGQVSEVASVVAFLLSSEASYINGQSLNVCGGMEMD